MAARNDDELAGVAFSYIRFSSAEQERGDSLRRQVALRQKWLERHPSVTLDGLKLQDLGVSAFRGRHRGDKFALGQFLDVVRAGRVPRGSILLIENLDRLSREEEEEALELFLGLLRAGIVVVQLEPETVFRKGDGMFGLMRAIMELSRGRQESARKSVRVSAAWSNLKRRVAAEGKIITRRCPSWLEVADGKFRFKPGAVATLKRIYAESLAGRGARMIAADLVADGVAHFCGGLWSHTFVGQLLTSRSVAGEYQPMKKVDGKRVKDGPPIAGYFPAAVTEQEWYAAQAALKGRKKKGGRRGAGGWVALFPNVWDARTGDRLHCIGRVYNGRRYRVLQQAAVGRFAGKCCSYPLDVFERAVLGRLRELDPADALAPAKDSSVVDELKRQVADLEGRLAGLKAELVSGAGEVKTVAAAARELEAALVAKQADLAAARRAAASPARDQWRTLKELAEAVMADPTLRVRLRAALDRLVDRVDTLVVPAGELRLAAVQVTFRETGVRRSYLIAHRPARRSKKGQPNKPAEWSVRSFAEVPKADAFDLREMADVAELEQFLSGIEV